jgi:DNA-binding NarL/FixJ family response regulator
MSSAVIRIVIAEDQALVLGALAALLKLEDDLDVVGTAGNGKDALALCRALRPDIVLTDVEMPQMTGLELAARLQELGLPSKVVIVTTFARSGYLRRALEAGVRGYLLKDAPAENLAAAIRVVHGGGGPRHGARAGVGKRARGPGPAVRPRAASAAAGRRGQDQRRDREAGAPVRGHRAQLFVGGDQQAECGQPDRGLSDGAQCGLALINMPS